MAQPGLIGLARGCVENTTQFAKGMWILHVDAEMDAVAHPAEFLEARYVRGEVTCVDLRDGFASESRADFAVVVKDDDPISGEPGIGLQSCCPEPKCKLERFEGVFLCVTSCASMTKENGRIQHETPLRHLVVGQESRISRL